MSHTRVLDIYPTATTRLLTVEIYEFQNFDLIFLGFVIMCLGFLFS